MQGVLFGDKHSYIDFKLITNSITIGIPAVKTNYVDIPCGNGLLDLTEALGEIKYGNRTLKFEFTLFGTDESDKTKIVNEIHGKKLKIILDKDKDFYYFGRCHVEDFNNDKNTSKLMILAECEPLKYKKAISIHREKIFERKKFICINRGCTVIPYIEVDASMRLEIDGRTYELKVGKQKVLGIQFKNGHNRITANGTGTIVFTFQEGVI